VAIRNTSTYGATLTSLGDGQDGSFWRQGGVWSSGTPTNTGIGIGSSYATGGNITYCTVSGGFNTYLVLFSFAQTSSAASVATSIFAGLSLNSSSSPFYAYQIGDVTTTSTNAFSGAYIYQPNALGQGVGLQSFTLNLNAKTGSGTATIAFGSITVIGIN
jgi:hypothetical protein